MTLRIGVDCRVLDDRYHGIGRVAYELAAAMAGMPGVHLVLFTGPGRSRRFDLAALAGRPAVSVRPTRMRPVAVSQLWRWRGELRRAGVDVMFFPYHLGASPIAGVPRVTLLHDCIFETDPRFVPSKRMYVAYRALTAAVAWTSTVLTVSGASAREVERFYRRRVPPERVISNGVDQRPVTGDVRRLRDELGLEPGYVLHVGAQRPHKNVPVLVAALSRLPGARLVLVGSADERFADEVGPAVERYGLGDRVRRLSFVPEELLGAVYANAGLLAYPSLVEGFGLPMLEAMVAGTPVLAGDVPVLREVGADAAAYVPPTDPDRWAAAIGRLLTDTAWRDELTAAGRSRAGEFTWKVSAARLVRACAQAAAKECEPDTMSVAGRRTT
jgi:glycosyltransferase involved in cell wall biosynthesis